MIKDTTIAIEESTMRYFIRFRDTDYSEPTEIEITHPTKLQFMGRNSLEQMLMRLAKGHDFYNSILALHLTSRIRLEPKSVKLLIARTCDDNWEAVKKMREAGII